MYIFNTYFIPLNNLIKSQSIHLSTLEMHYLLASPCDEQEKELACVCSHCTLSPIHIFISLQLLNCMSPLCFISKGWSNHSLMSIVQIFQCLHIPATLLFSFWKAEFLLPSRCFVFAFFPGKWCWTFLHVFNHHFCNLLTHLNIWNWVICVPT